MTDNNANEIMEKLDLWVSKRGNGQYIAPDSKPSIDYGITEEWGIQQVKKEIDELVNLLIQKKFSGEILEIGLGYYGSTHYLWRQIFSHVVTIEKSHDRIRVFGENIKEEYGKWVLNNGSSSFLIGLSNEPSTIKKVYDAVSGLVDVLFIDGDHSYEGVLADWLLYHSLVKPGGIVVFHDTALSIPDSFYGVPKLISQLKEGKLDGKPKKIVDIIHSDNQGISYYEND